MTSLDAKARRTSASFNLAVDGISSSAVAASATSCYAFTSHSRVQPAMPRDVTQIAPPLNPKCGEPAVELIPALSTSALRRFPLVYRKPDMLDVLDVGRRDHDLNECVCTHVVPALTST